MRASRLTPFAKTVSAVVLSAVAISAAVAGCGGDDSEASEPPSPPVESLPDPSPIKGKFDACDLLPPKEVSAYLETPLPDPEDDSFVPDVSDRAALPPMLECNYVDESTGLVVLSVSVDAMDPYAADIPETLDLQMTGHDTSEDLTVGGFPAAYGPPIQEGGMPKLSVVAPDHPWIHVVSLTADSPVADRDTLTTLAERLLVRLGV